MAEISIAGNLWPLIEPGEYDAVLDYYETNQAAFGGKPKVYLVIRLVTPGLMGEQLFAAFNVKKLVGKSGRSGSFKLTRRQDLTLQLAKIVPGFRLDRISLAPLKNRLLTVEVRTVTRDYKQRPLPDSMQYSVVDSILSISEGVRTNDP